MLVTAVLAVALGLTPVKEDSSTQTVRVNEAEIVSKIGRYSQTIDKRGATHVRGSDRLGRAYDLTLDRSGHVEGSVGDWVISFNVSEPA